MFLSVCLLPFRFFCLNSLFPDFLLIFILSSSVLPLPLFSKDRILCSFLLFRLPLTLPSISSILYFSRHINPRFDFSSLSNHRSLSNSCHIYNYFLSAIYRLPFTLLSSVFIQETVLTSLFPFVTFLIVSLICSSQFRQYSAFSIFPLLNFFFPYPSFLPLSSLLPLLTPPFISAP